MARRKAAPIALAVFSLLMLAAGLAAASEVKLKDGRVIAGDLGAISSLTDKTPPAGGDDNAPLQLIILMDDKLRRVFVPKRQVVEAKPEQTGQVEERFNIHQRVMQQGSTVKSVGVATRIDPFDEYGRRTYSFPTARAPADVIQGITELTPHYAKVEGLTHVWDLRIATSSIPKDTLHRILMRQVDPNDIEQQKKIARFYLQAERFEEAYAQLKAIADQSANKPEVVKQLQPTIRAIRQLSAQRLLGELQLRRDAGQHQFVAAKLKEFPTEDVNGEILQAVQAMLVDYQGLEARRREALEHYDAELAKVRDSAIRLPLAEIGDELKRELNIETIARLAPFRQNYDDPQLQPTEKLALAVSGWLLGPDRAAVNVQVALSAYRVRGKLRQYLASKTPAERNEIFLQLSAEEAAAPGIVTPLLANMKPPIDPPPPVDGEKRPGEYRIEIPGLPKEAPLSYLVQLPPEYDPYHNYPTIVSLHSATTTPAMQLDWWAGEWTPGGWRAGQASRHGYIVVAPAWGAPHQSQYGFTPKEHLAVVACLRDACQRFAVDTDRVFITGHDMGGDAAWDIALAHPDLWAGAMPIGATVDKFIVHYWPNAERIPFYFVGGEFDTGKSGKNARDLDRYLTRGFNSTVVEYQGRGHDSFSDEIHHLFDWMGRFHRDFFPREFNVVTMRASDNFFWWVELAGLPPGSSADAAHWPPPRGTQPMQLKAQITKTNGLYVQTGSARITLWVSPEMLDFQQRANIVVNGQRVNSSDRYVQPDLLTLIEDVRTRGDRRHPFWAKIEAATGRIKGGT